jgi:hypothetical protein
MRLKKPAFAPLPFQDAFQLQVSCFHRLPGSDDGSPDLKKLKNLLFIKLAAVQITPHETAKIKLIVRNGPILNLVGGTFVL